MKRHATLCAVCLMALTAAVCAQEAPAPAEDVIEIDAPGVLDKPGATYLLTRDVTAEKTAFMIKGDGITLDLGGHTVTYGTAVGVDRCSGVFLRPGGSTDSFKGVPKEGFGGGNRFTLRNGRIVQGRQPVAPPGAIKYSGGRIVKETGDHPRPGRSCFAVYVRGCTGLEITGVTTEVNSRDTDNLYVRGCADVHVHHNRCISRVREITDRHWPGTGVITVEGVRGPAEVDHNVIDGGGQWGIRFSGGSRTGHLVQVHHNVVAHRSYTTNGYALGCHAPNMRVYANVVKSVGRGVHLGGNSIDFFNNIIDPREKPNPEYPRTRTHGIKFEGATNSIVHHNYSRVVADPSCGDASPLDFSVATFSANRVYKNTFVAVRNTPKLDAYSVNLYSIRPNSLTRISDNVFRTNHVHFRTGWGGARGFTFERNRFEIVGEPTDYAFFLIRQSSAVRSRDMVFRDSVLGPGADYGKVRMLYDRKYTRAHLDFAVEWTVNVRTVDPAGRAVRGVAVRALQGEREVAASVTDAGGKAAVVLADFHLIGNLGKDPIEQHGPYEIVFSQGAREVGRRKVDPTKTTDLTVTVTDPKRKLYVYAGPDQRHETGETAQLAGKVVVVGQEGAKPDVTWRISRGRAKWPIADAKAASTTAAMNANGSGTLEIQATLGDETAKDTFAIRTDARATPTAVAAAPKSAKVKTIVQLDGLGSKDPRGFPKSALKYQWKQVGGPETVLSSDEWPDPIFFPERPGTYTFELTMSNPIRTSAPVRCSVEVTE